MKFFIVLLCVLPLISGMAVDTSTQKCYVSYLKSKGFLGAKSDSPTEVTPECLAIVQSAQAEEAVKLREIYAEDEDTVKQADCIITKLKKTDIFDRKLIHSLDLSASKADDATMAESEGLGLLTSMLNMVKALVSCDVEKIFDDAFTAKVKSKFDILFTHENDEDKEDNVDYCVRKHLVDNNLITFNSDKFNVNPKNLDTSAIDCTVLYPQYVKKYEGHLLEAYKSEESEDEEKNWEGCYTKIIRNNNYIDQILQFDYVTEFHLTPEQKEELRSIFAEVLTNVTKTAVKCLVPDGLAGL